MTNASCVPLQLMTIYGSSVNVSWLMNGVNDVAMTQQLSQTYGGSSAVRNCTANQGCTLVTGTNPSVLQGYQQQPNPTPPSGMPSSMVAYYSFGSNCSSPALEINFEVANGTCLQFGAIPIPGGHIPQHSARVFRLRPSTRGWRVIRFYDSINCSGASSPMNGKFGSTCAVGNLTYVTSAGQTQSGTVQIQAFLTAQPTLSAGISSSSVYNVSGGSYVGPSAHTWAPTTTTAVTASPTAQRDIPNKSSSGSKKHHHTVVVAVSVTCVVALLIIVGVGFYCNKVRKAARSQAYLRLDADPTVGDDMMVSGSAFPAGDDGDINLVVVEPYDQEFEDNQDRGESHESKPYEDENAHEMGQYEGDDDNFEGL